MTTTTKKLLIVDDEADLLAELQPMLTRAGDQVITATDGEAALARVAHEAPDLIILDVLMPKLDGRATLRRLREQDNWVPVILLTQINTALERVMSLQEGADDYLNKPFDPMELLARIQAILRRVDRSAPSTATAQLLTSGELRVDRQARSVSHRGQIVELTTRAFDLLVFLMRNAQEAIGRDRLLDEVWGWSYAVSTRAVDIRIAEIRKALEDNADAPHYTDATPWTRITQIWRIFRRFFLGANRYTDNSMLSREPVRMHTCQVLEVWQVYRWGILKCQQSLLGYSLLFVLQAAMTQHRI